MCDQIANGSDVAIAGGWTCLTDRKVVKCSKLTVFLECSGPARAFNLVSSKTCCHSGRTPSSELGLGLPFIN